MNGVLGMLHLLKDSSLDSQQTRYVDLALQAGRNLLRILSDILDLSRMEAGALRLHREAFTTADLIKPILGLLKGKADRKGLRLRVETDPSLPERLLGDPGRIRQVLINLLDNAIKYTTKGEVRLELYPLPVARPGFVCLHMVVADTGIGIPDHQLKMVLEPFTQADESYTRQQGGAGLGLSIVKRLVSLMDGAVAICSEPGRGAEVHVSLWLEPATESAAQDAPPGRPEAGRGRILVVEDDPIGRLALVKTLEAWGYAASQAADGRKALALLEREAHDAVLMDIQMPRMDGLEATRRIRASTSGKTDPRVPIIALTAYAMAGDREKFLEAGMDDYLAKPVDQEALRRVLARLGGPGSP